MCQSEGVLHIPQSSHITGTSPSDCIVSYSGYSLEVGGLTCLQRSSWLSNKKPLRYIYIYIYIYTIYIYIYIHTHTHLPTQAGYDTRSIFKWSLTGLNSEFSFSQTSCLTKAEEPSLPYYLPRAGERIIGFIPFPKVLQSVSSRIWTRVTMSIYYDDNHYTTGISFDIYIYIYKVKLAT